MRSPQTKTPRTAQISLMGVLNVTPDSFYDGGRFADPGRAIRMGRALEGDGAAIIDVGGESTRPGSTPVSAALELHRIMPVIEGLREGSAAISVDTSKALVAEAALDAGAVIVNDVSALRADSGMAALIADRGAIVVLMHSQNWQGGSTVVGPGRNLIADIIAFFEGRLEAASRAGIRNDRIYLDPGIGFGKRNPEDNLEILARLDEFRGLGCRIMVGPSRKSFIGCLDGSPPTERLGGTVAACLAAAVKGVDILRVHDVFPVRQALLVSSALLGPIRFETSAHFVPSR